MYPIVLVSAYQSTGRMRSQARDVHFRKFKDLQRTALRLMSADRCSNTLIGQVTEELSLNSIRMYQGGISQG